MMSHLKLVADTGFLDEKPWVLANFSTKQTSVQHLEVRSLSPNRSDERRQEVAGRAHRTSYFPLGLVFFVHLLALVWVVNVKPLPPKLKEPAPPMLVSLVANPAPEPELVPIVPPPPQPVIKQRKPVIKKVVIQKQPVPEPQVAEPEISQPVAVAEVTPAPVAAAKAPEVVEPPAPKVVEPVIEPPRFGAAYLNNPAPDYPPLSRRLGEEGRVLLRVLVSEGGLAETVQIEKSSGSAKLDQAAIQAVKKWSFIPAKKSNQPISAYVLVPVKFSLEG